MAIYTPDQLLELITNCNDGSMGTPGECAREWQQCVLPLFLEATSPEEAGNRLVCMHGRYWVPTQDTRERRFVVLGYANTRQWPLFRVMSPGDVEMSPPLRGSRGHVHVATWWWRAVRGLEVDAFNM